MVAKVEMDKSLADAALVAFAEVADAMELDWCVFAGTCLGLFRDGKFLPDDNDLDVAVKATDEQRERLWDELYLAGFKLGRWCENRDGTRNRHCYYHPEMSHPDSGGILVDVFYTFTEAEANVLNHFDQVTYRDRNYLTPHPVQAYLQLAYGDWWDKTLRNSAAGKEGVRRGD